MKLETSRDYIRSIARKFVRTEHELDDVVQDAMLQAHRYRDNFRGESAYSSWLYRVTANVALNYIKKRNRVTALASSDAGEDGGTASLERYASSEDLGASAAARDVIADARDVVTRMGDKYALFWNAVELGMTEPEIAKAHNISVAAVKARIHQARSAVRAALAREIAA